MTNIRALMISVLFWGIFLACGSDHPFSVEESEQFKNFMANIESRKHTFELERDNIKIECELLNEDSKHESLTTMMDSHDNVQTATNGVPICAGYIRRGTIVLSVVWAYPNSYDIWNGFLDAIDYINSRMASNNINIYLEIDWVQPNHPASKISPVVYVTVGQSVGGNNSPNWPLGSNVSKVYLTAYNYSSMYYLTIHELAHTLGLAHAQGHGNDPLRVWYIYPNTFVQYSPGDGITIDPNSTMADAGLRGNRLSFLDVQALKRGVLSP